MGQPSVPPPGNPPGWPPAPAGFGPNTPNDFTQPNAPVSPDRPSPYAPSAAPPPTPRRPWGAAFIGLAAGLVIAVAVAAVLLATNVLHFGAAPAPAATVSSAAITLPAELGGYSDVVAVNKTLLANSSMSEAKKAAALAAQQSNQQKVAALTLTSYQAANPGAAVAYRAYADAKLLHVAGVIVVRASYPGVTNGPVVDPAYLGLAVAREQVKVFGEVQCVVAQQQITRAGSQVDPENEITTMCQRTGTALTVQVYGSAFNGAADQQSMAALTNAAWTSVSG